VEGGDGPGVGRRGDKSEGICRDVEGQVWGGGRIRVRECGGKWRGEAWGRRCGDINAGLG
jgi:hypothetical protein